MKADIRRNVISGLVPVEGLHDGQILFTEWWNGEGITFELTDKDGVSNRKTIDLHQDEIETIAAIAKFIGLYDSDSIFNKVNQWKIEEKEREKRI